MYRACSASEKYGCARGLQRVQSTRHRDVRRALFRSGRGAFRSGSVAGHRAVSRETTSFCGPIDGISFARIFIRCPIHDFPFWACTFTPRVNGEIWLGPNAVLAFSRTGYQFTNINFGDLRSTFGSSGFRTFARRNWRTGFSEMERDLRRPAS